jgi:uncharacterized protein YbbK (DUF523 family)
MYLVSACLAGVNCRYNGGNCANKNIQSLANRGEAIAVCPEQLGGLPTPRQPYEIVIGENGKENIIGKDGRAATKEFYAGAEKALAIAKVIGAKTAILKSKSPSCGCGLIYDGTFSGKLISGNGITAKLLLENGIKVYTENDFDKVYLFKGKSLWSKE